MNPDGNSSSSSDELFGDMVTSIITMNESFEQEEDYIIENVVQNRVVPLVTTTYGRPPSKKIRDVTLKEIVFMQMKG